MQGGPVGGSHCWSHIPPDEHEIYFSALRILGWPRDLWVRHGGGPTLPQICYVPSSLVCGVARGRGGSDEHHHCQWTRRDQGRQADSFCLCSYYCVLHNNSFLWGRRVLWSLSRSQSDDAGAIRPFRATILSCKGSISQTFLPLVPSSRTQATSSLWAGQAC